MLVWGQKKKLNTLGKCSEDNHWHKGKILEEMKRKMFTGVDADTKIGM